MRTGILAAALGLALTAGPAAADDSVTPAEVIAKVREAAAYLGKEGKAGLAAFEGSGSPFVWKGTYVFVFDCAEDTIVAHPVTESRGLKISSLRDPNGKAYGRPLCDAATAPNGSWEDYVWPKPVAGGAAGGLAYTKDAHRKVSFMMTVAGTPYQVGAGIYEPSMSLADLDALAAK